MTKVTVEEELKEELKWWPNKGMKWAENATAPDRHYITTCPLPEVQVLPVSGIE